MLLHDVVAPWREISETLPKKLGMCLLLVCCLGSASYFHGILVLSKAVQCPNTQRDRVGWKWRKSPHLHPPLLPPSLLAVEQLQVIVSKEICSRTTDTMEVVLFSVKVGC